MFTVRQVAEFFQVTEHTVRSWINGRNGRPVLKATKIGSSYRIWKSDAVAYGEGKYGL